MKKKKTGDQSIFFFLCQTPPDPLSTHPSSLPPRSLLLLLLPRLTAEASGGKGKEARGIGLGVGVGVRTPGRGDRARWQSTQDQAKATSPKGIRTQLSNNPLLTHPASVEHPGSAVGRRGHTGRCPQPLQPPWNRRRRRRQLAASRKGKDRVTLKRERTL